MSGRPSDVVRRRGKFIEAVDELRMLEADTLGMLEDGGAWADEHWKAHTFVEMLGVRLYTEWERFTHDLLILWLAKDTTALATHTGLSIGRKRITKDMAEALLTSRSYLEFRDTSQLKSRARRWLVNSPFEALTRHDEGAADDLRALRNYIVHRSRQSVHAYRRLLNRRNIRNERTPGQFLAGGKPSKLNAYMLTLHHAASRLV